LTTRRDEIFGQHVVHLSLEDAIIGRHQKMIADVASLPQQFANFGDLTSRSESQV
jgi:hypothetical protein